MISRVLKTKIGFLEVCFVQDKVARISILDNQQYPPDTNFGQLSQFQSLVINELNSYFEGKLKGSFSFLNSLLLEGTQFQINVWKQLINIPFGQVRTYKEVAESVGNENAYRAVAQACHNNKLLVVVPCHRVIGSNNSLTGFAAGIWRKEYLLKNIEGIKI